MNNTVNWENFWLWVLRHKTACWILGVDYKTGCFKKTGCMAG